MTEQDIFKKMQSELIQVVLSSKCQHSHITIESDTMTELELTRLHLLDYHKLQLQCQLRQTEILLKYYKDLKMNEEFMELCFIVMGLNKGDK